MRGDRQVSLWCMTIFIDSSVIVAYANTKEVHHAKAQDIFKRIEEGVFGEPFISDYVFSEVVTVVQMRVGKEKAVEMGNYLLDCFHLLSIKDSLFTKSWEVFCSRQGMLSFTDASILAVTEVLPVKYVASFDKELAKNAKVKVVS